MQNLCKYFCTNIRIKFEFEQFDVINPRKYTGLQIVPPTKNKKEPKILLYIAYSKFGVFSLWPFGTEVVDGKNAAGCTSVFFLPDNNEK